jgi:predicted dienelactone hydrolase
MPITYMPPAVSETRTLDLHIWYPTTVDSGETAVYELAFKDPKSFVDAPLAPPLSPDGYPVHVYSHGHRGFGGTSSFMMRHFASHGWVAVAPDHTTNTLTDNVEPRPMNLYFLRGMDIIATLDALDFFGTEDPLKGLVRTDGVLLSGHSFGSHTCWSVAGASFDMDLIPEACSGAGAMPDGECTIKELGTFEGGLRDPRVVAAMPMAGTINRSLFGLEGHKSVDIPVLFMSGTLDPVGAEEHFEETNDIDLTWIEIEGGCHQAFALGFCEELESEEGFQIVNTYAMAFAHKYVLGLDDDHVNQILDGSYSVSDKVSFKKKP